MSTGQPLYADSISTMQSYAGTVTTIIVQDPNVGGTFNYVPGSFTIYDNIINFQATGIGSGIWQRQFNEVEGVNVLWANAKGNAGVAFASVVNATTLLYVQANYGTVISPAANGQTITVCCGSSSFQDIEGVIGTVSGSVPLSSTITLSTGSVTAAVAPTSVAAMTSSAGGWLPANSYQYYVVAIYNYAYSAAVGTSVVSNSADNGAYTISWNIASADAPYVNAYAVFRILNEGSHIDTGYYLVPATGSTSISFTDTGGQFYGYQTISTINIIPIVFGTDDTASINNVSTLPYNMLFPSGHCFKITNQINSLEPAAVVNRKISAYGATIIRNNGPYRIFLFSGSNTIPKNDITIEGGIWTSIAPVDGTDIAHCFEFDTCTNISVLNTHINGSPQMGVGLNSVVGANIAGNIIENCFRDGIYSQYSYYLKYTNNTIKNIKDDAMSIHDYGDASAKVNFPPNLFQAGNAIVSGNIVDSAYEGFSSIGGADITVADNQFLNTVTSGISFFNTLATYDLLYNQSGIRVSRISILNNILKNNCSTIYILGALRTNSATSITHNLAAIGIDSEGTDGNYTSADINFRSNSVNIENNKIYDCAYNAVLAHQIDGLTIANNYAHNCNGTTSANTGDTFFMLNCTLASLIGNEAIDNRVTDVVSTIGSISASSTTFTRISYSGGSGYANFLLYPTPAFTSADIGKKILITGAYNSQSPIVTITAVASADTITVSRSADNAVSDVFSTYGPFDTNTNNFIPLPVQRKCYSVQNTSGYMDFWSANAWTDPAPGEIVTNSAGMALINVFTPDNFKKQVKAATTASIGLSGPTTIDGVVVNVGDLVLVKNQSTASQNGIYMVQDSAWTRTIDTCLGAQLIAASIYVATGGTVNGNTQWLCSNITPPYVSSDSITFSPAGFLSYTPMQTAGTLGLFLNQTTGVIEKGNTTLTVVSQDLVSQTSSNTILYNSPTLATYCIYIYFDILSNTGSQTMNVSIDFINESSEPAGLTLPLWNSYGETIDYAGVTGHYVIPNIILRCNTSTDLGSSIAIQIVVETGSGVLTYDAGIRIVLI
jgi:hypothetical protein